MAYYKVCNKDGCKHKDPKGWKFEQHKCYVQKEWREGCAIEDLVSLKCLHCHSLLEEQPKTMKQTIRWQLQWRVCRFAVVLVRFGP